MSPLNAPRACLAAAARPLAAAPRRAALLAAVPFGLLAAGAPPASAAGLQPSAFFVEPGAAKRTASLGLGLAWDAPHRWSLAGGEVTAVVDLTLARWRTQASATRGERQVTRLGVTPTLRWRGDGGAAAWFAEVGIGANVIAPRYARDEREFSTTFNFGDHLGVGRSFGAGRETEVSLRLQHFSNAGIRQPNPGENFLQLRVARRF